MPTLRQFLETSARRASSLFATICAPLSGLQEFIVRVRDSSVSERADFGVNFECMDHLWLSWAEAAYSYKNHKDALAHPEILSEYGRLLHFEFPEMLNRMDSALMANVK